MVNRSALGKKMHELTKNYPKWMGDPKAAERVFVKNKLKVMRVQGTPAEQTMFLLQDSEERETLRVEIWVWPKGWSFEWVPHLRKHMH